jgi:hypothetical protein
VEIETNKCPGSRYASAYRGSQLGSRKGAGRVECDKITDEQIIAQEKTTVMRSIAVHNIGFGAQGMSIRVAEPPVNTPRTYVLEYGFNKD